MLSTQKCNTFPKIHTPFYSLSFKNIIPTLINFYKYSAREASSGRSGCPADTPIRGPWAPGSSRARPAPSTVQPSPRPPPTPVGLPAAAAAGFVSRAGLPPPAAAQQGSGGAVQHPGAESRSAGPASPCKGHAQARPGAERTWRRTCSSSGSCREYRGGEGRPAGRPLEEQSLQGCIPARPLELENAVTDGRIGPGGDKPFSQPSFCF